MPRSSLNQRGGLQGPSPGTEGLREEFIQPGTRSAAATGWSAQKGRAAAQQETPTEETTRCLGWIR